MSRREILGYVLSRLLPSNAKAPSMKAKFSELEVGRPRQSAASLEGMLAEVFADPECTGWGCDWSADTERPSAFHSSEKEPWSAARTRMRR